MPIKFNVEYEITPIRFVSVFCPECNHEFDAREHGKCENGSWIHDAVDLQYATFGCTDCGHSFSTRDEKIEIDGS